MATAAIAAPPMTSTSFQSASNAFNDATPSAKSRDAMGRQDWASYKADGLLRSHRPHESLCENLRISSSGAKARWIMLTLMSDLKVRPPVAAPAPLSRILTKLGPQGYSVLRGMHRITQHANSGDGDFNDIASDQGADTRRRAGSDDVARKKRHHARNPANEKGDGINHQRGLAGLAESAVDVRFDMQAGGIEIGFDMRANGTERIEAFAAGELYVALLEVARSDVVEAGVAEKEGKRIVGVAQV